MTDLQVLANQITAQNASIMTQLGPEIADRLRKNLPDMSDLDIGRVRVAVGTTLLPIFVSWPRVPVGWPKSRPIGPTSGIEPRSSGRV